MRNLAAKPAAMTATVILSNKKRTSTRSRGTPRIVLFGDSHSYAVQRAVEKRKGKGFPVPLEVHRLLKEKNGSTIGNLRFEDFLALIGDLSAGDVVVSMIGGNQHAVFSTIPHPQPFDFYTIEGDSPPAGGVDIIPYRALSDAFSTGLRKGDMKSLEAIRDATEARVIHVCSPPPKADNDFIAKHHETLFAQEGIASRGVSPPELRLKFWKLQVRILQRLCKRIGVEMMMPPARAVSDGFLRPEFYAADATHANWLYGERVIRELERRFVPQQGDAGK